MERDQFEDLLYQSLEHEEGSVDVYTAALRCVQNEDLRRDWTKYLGQTRQHARAIRTALAALGLDPEKERPSRAVVRALNQAFVAAIERGLATNQPATAQLVAAECVVLAETKDHLDWELIAEGTKALTGDEKARLEALHEQVEDEEDEHLYYSAGWARELWLEALDLPAVLPPPEEQRHASTAIGAARARQSRGELISSAKTKKIRGAARPAKAE